MASFKAANFKSKLDTLSESAQSIQTLSHWVCYYRKAAKESAQIWAQEALRAKPERRLLYVYLANDVMQNSRRKGPEFVQEFGGQMTNVMPEAYASSSESARSKLMKVVGVWEERRVLDQRTIDDLRGAMGSGGGGARKAEAPEAEASMAPRSLDVGKPLPEYLEWLDEACGVEPLRAEREAALPLAALTSRDSAGLTPQLLDKAVQMLPQQMAQLKEELVARQQLVLLLAAACDKQVALFGRLRGAIDECASLLGSAESIRAVSEADTEGGDPLGGYSPSDP